MSRLTKQTLFVVFIQKTFISTVLLQSADIHTLQCHTEVVISGLSELYNPDLLDPEEKEHLVEVFDSDKDIDINRLIRRRNQFDKVRAEEQESVILRWEEKFGDR